tara:strand:+ start:404 stop:598 length:195 start_codon:yes stop_codon:yes gene_type:complete
MTKELTLCEMLANYRKELEAKSDNELQKEIYHEMGIDADNVEVERDVYIDELVEINKAAWSSRI